MNQAANLLSDRTLQIALPSLQNCMMNAAHHIGTVSCLRIQRRLHGTDTPRLQIDKLGDKRGCTQVDGYAQSFPRLKLELRVIDENCRIPLPQFNFKISLGNTLAGQPPSLLDFFFGKDFSLRSIQSCCASQQPNAASPAAAAAAARELYSMLKQQVPQRGPRRRVHLGAGGLQNNAMTGIRAHAVPVSITAGFPPRR